MAGTVAPDFEAYNLGLEAGCPEVGIIETTAFRVASNVITNPAILRA
jgi:hypothetical protein